MLIIDDTEVTTSQTIIILSITFDIKLSWGPQVTNIISNEKRALNGLKLKRKLFDTRELLSIVTSNFYSVLYYNCLDGGKP